MKRVLIIGEFSGVGKSFFEGFKKYDDTFKVDHITDGDGYKNLGKNYLYKFSIFRYLFIIFNALVSSTKKYDYGLWLSPFVFKRPLFLIKFLNFIIIRVCKINILYCCTSDSVYWRNYDLNKNRKALLGFLQDYNFKVHHFAKKSYYNYNIKFVSKMNFIFSSSEVYYYPYSKVCETSILRYPVSTYSLNCQIKPKKINHYHGITRTGIKGSDYILEKLKLNNIRPLITKKISNKEFCNYLKETIVYHDQYHTIFPGIAALLSLFYCPYVFSSIDKSLILDDVYAKNCPITDYQKEFDLSKINLEDPEVHKEKILSNRKFLKEYHDPKKIVNQMLSYINEVT